MAERAVMRELFSILRNKISIRDKGDSISDKE